MRLIHITDPHLTSLAHLGLRDIRGKQWLGYQSWLRKRQYLHLRANLDRLMQAVAARQPDLLCITGDLIHIAHTDELKAATQWLKSLGPPEQIVLLPGNHDLYQPRAWPFVAEHWRPWLRLSENAKTDEPRAGWPVSIESRGVSIDSLNSSIPMPWYSAQGELGSAQVDRLVRMPADQYQPNILLLHHPPLSPREDPSISRRKALRDSARLRPLLARYDIVLHGHTHRNTCLNSARTRIYATASASASNASFRQFDFARTGDAWHISMQLHQLGNDSVTQIAAEQWTRTLGENPNQPTSDPFTAANG